MAKLNWDRIRDVDRVRGDKSDMELADERDERWFERERQREESRGVAREVRGVSMSSTKVDSAKRGPKPSKSKRKARDAALASSLGVSADELQRARVAHSSAGNGLDGAPPNEKRVRTAARLGITPPELKLVRQAMAGTVDPSARARVASLIRQIARSGGAASPPPVRGSTTRVGARSTTGVKPSKKIKAQASAPPGGSPQVFVTTWGNVVHLYHDCHSTRGFRHASEPDPDIYRVSVTDPSCRGRRVCGTCARNNYSGGQGVDRMLRKYHGAAFDEKDWERYGWSRPVPSGDPINRKRR